MRSCLLNACACGNVGPCRWTMPLCVRPRVCHHMFVTLYVGLYMHAHTHAHTHAHSTHTRTHTCTHTQSHAHGHAYTHRHRPLCNGLVDVIFVACTYIPSHSLLCKHTRTHTHTHTHTGRCATAWSMVYLLCGLPSSSLYRCGRAFYWQLGT